MRGNPSSGHIERSSPPVDSTASRNGYRQVAPKQRNTASTSRACGQLSSGDRAALAADGEADRIGQEIGR